MIFLPPKSGRVLAGGSVVATGVDVAGVQAAARNVRIKIPLKIRRAFILFSFLILLTHGGI
jgi:hypothetical protein